LLPGRQGAAPRSRASRTPPAPDRAAAGRGQGDHRVLGGVNLLLGLAALAAVWGALPARVLLVDLAGSAVGVAFLVAGVGLLLRAPWGVPAALGAGVLVLGVGLVLVATLTITAAHLVGLYGPVGGGGALILGIVAALLLPYLVILPASQVWRLLPR